MRIVILGTLTNVMNGSARSFARLSEFLSKNHELIPIIPDSEGIGSQLVATNPLTIVTPYVPVRRSLKNILRVPFDIIKLKQLISELNPDVIYVNDIPWFYSILIGKILKVPSIMHSRYYEANVIVRYIIKKTLSKFDAIIYVSHYNKKLWNMPDTCNNHVLHNPGIRTHVLKNDVLIGIPMPYLLIVSRISEEKGILEAIKSFSELCKFDKEVCLVIAGDVQLKSQGEYLERCKQCVCESGLENRVVWLGKVDFPHILYKHASCYLHLPNFEDPFPTTILEALSLGCRIISRKRGGIPEQVDGFEGILMIDPTVDNGKLIYDFLRATPCHVDRDDKYGKMFDETNFLSGLEKIIESVGNRFNRHEASRL